MKNLWKNKYIRIGTIVLIVLLIILIIVFIYEQKQKKNNKPDAPGAGGYNPGPASGSGGAIDASFPLQMGSISSPQTGNVAKVQAYLNSKDTTLPALDPDGNWGANTDAKYYAVFNTHSMNKPTYDYLIGSPSPILTSTTLPGPVSPTSSGPGTGFGYYDGNGVWQVIQGNQQGTSSGSAGTGSGGSWWDTILNNFNGSNFLG